MGISLETPKNWAEFSLDALATHATKLSSPCLSRHERRQLHLGFRRADSRARCLTRERLVARGTRHRSPPRHLAHGTACIVAHDDLGRHRRGNRAYWPAGQIARLAELGL